MQHPAWNRRHYGGTVEILLGVKWDNPTMIVTLDSKCRLTVPASLAAASPGEYFDPRLDAEQDAIVFRRLPERGKTRLAGRAQAMSSQHG